MVRRRSVGSEARSKGASTIFGPRSLTSDADPRKDYATHRRCAHCQGAWPWNSAAGRYDEEQNDVVIIGHIVKARDPG